jgi:hypothetical protein
MSRSDFSDRKLFVFFFGVLGLEVSIARPWLLVRKKALAARRKIAKARVLPAEKRGTQSEKQQQYNAQRKHFNQGNQPRRSDSLLAAKKREQRLRGKVRKLVSDLSESAEATEKLQLSHDGLLNDLQRTQQQNQTLQKRLREVQENLESALDAVEDLLRRQREQEQPLSFLLPNGSYTPEFQMACAKIQFKGVPREVVEILCEFFTARKCNNRANDLSQGGSKQVSSHFDRIATHPAQPHTHRRNSRRGVDSAQNSLHQHRRPSNSAL